MSIIRATIFSSFLSGARAAGLERQPPTVGVQGVGSGQIFEEPSAESPAPPAIVEIPLNRETRRALHTPKGQFAAFVADQSVCMTALIESIDAHYSAVKHRERSMQTTQF